jgi:hypothetical protein
VNTAIALLGIIGTLVAGLGATLIQGRAARLERGETRTEADRAAQLEAVVALTSAVADHLRAMWMREDLRLSRADAAAVAAAREASHVTRSALTAPLTRVRVLVPSLSGPAREAAQAAYNLRNAPDSGELAQLRETAVAARESFVESAGLYFA